MSKKKVSFYVDAEKYDEFRSMTKITGDTITDIIDTMMTEYIGSIKMLIETPDKEALLKIIDERMKKIENDIDKALQLKGKE